MVSPLVSRVTTRIIEEMKPFAMARYFRLRTKFHDLLSSTSQHSSICKERICAGSEDFGWEIIPATHKLKKRCFMWLMVSVDSVPGLLGQ